MKLNKQTLFSSKKVTSKRRKTILCVCVCVCACVCVCVCVRVRYVSLKQPLGRDEAMENGTKHPEHDTGHYFFFSILLYDAVSVSRCKALNIRWLATHQWRMTNSKDSGSNWLRCSWDKMPTFALNLVRKVAKIIWQVQASWCPALNWNLAAPEQSCYMNRSALFPLTAGISALWSWLKGLGA